MDGEISGNILSVPDDTTHTTVSSLSFKNASWGVWQRKIAECYYPSWHWFTNKAYLKVLCGVGYSTKYKSSKNCPQIGYGLVIGLMREIIRLIYAH